MDVVRATWDTLITVIGIMLYISGLLFCESFYLHLLSSKHCLVQDFAVTCFGINTRLWDSSIDLG